MVWKILYREKQLRGSNPYRNRVMKDILKKDTKHILNRRTEVKEFYRELQKHGSGGLTKREMKKVLAHFKYGEHDSLTRKEINTLARELGIKTKFVHKGRIPKDDRKNTKAGQKLSHAKHEAEYLRPHHTRRHKNTLRNSFRDRSFTSSIHDSQTSETHSIPTRSPIRHAGIRENYMAAQYRHTR